MADVGLLVPAPLWGLVPWLTAAVVAVSGHRAGALNRRGAMAATLVGGCAMAGGVGPGALLVGWFVWTTGWSRAGRARKAARTGSVVAKGGARDAWQVAANGGVYALGVLVALGAPALAPMALVAATGALAAAGADTLATEVGTWWGGDPWSLRTRRRVATGTSGAVTPVGTAALGVSALVVAALAAALAVISWRALPAVVAGGVAGALADTVAGAWLQLRRWCPACDTATEQDPHDCGAATRVAGGWRWLDNDAVNLLATVVGAAVAWGVWGGR
ncbi:MAG: DUF92 domain-containing protein [Gemmatimonadetes bacterium]|nr:DUF92 domain-containing protein [Gemmatimonadota bacterium]